MLIKHDGLLHLNTEETTLRIVWPYIHSWFYCDEHSYHKAFFPASNPSTQLGWQNFTVKPTTNFLRHKTTNVYSLCIKARGTLCPLWRQHGSGTLEEYANQPLQQFACLLIALLSRVCVCERSFSRAADKLVEVVRHWTFIDTVPLALDQHVPLWCLSGDECL